MLSLPERGPRCYKAFWRWSIGATVAVMDSEDKNIVLDSSKAVDAAVNVVDHSGELSNYQLANDPHRWVQGRARLTPQWASNAPCTAAGNLWGSRRGLVRLYRRTVDLCRTVGPASRRCHLVVRHLVRK
jgi:hypothetical protein